MPNGRYLELVVVLFATACEAESTRPPRCEDPVPYSPFGTYVEDVMVRSTPRCVHLTVIGGPPSLTLSELPNGGVQIGVHAGTILPSGRFEITAEIAEEANNVYGQATIMGMTDGISLKATQEFDGYVEDVACSESSESIFRKVLDQDRRWCCECVAAVGCYAGTQQACEQVIATDVDVAGLSPDCSYTECEARCWFRPYWI